MVHTFTGGELVKWLTDELNLSSDAIKIRDGSYRPVKKSHLLGDHYDYVASLLQKRGLTEWDKDWDCDDFTQLFVLESHIAHRHAQRKFGFETEAEMVFEVWVRDIAHAIVGCVEYQQGKLYPFFVEPNPKTQSRQVALSKDEIKSINLWK